MVIPRLTGLGIVLVAAATATCGLFMLGGVGPATGGALTGEQLPAIDDDIDDIDDDDDPTTSSTSTTTTTTVPTTIPTTTTTTTIPTTTTTTTAPTPAPIPESVSSSQTMVGAGGTVTFDGTCPVANGEPLGPVVVWVVGLDSQTITTEMTAQRWSYTWTAPTDPSEFSSFTFQFWCGDPAGYQGGYPAELQLIVDMVAVAPPTTEPSGEPDPPTLIPATD